MEEAKKKCPLCNNTDNVQNEGFSFECPICGRFQIDITTEDLLLNCPEIINDNLRLKIRYSIKKNDIAQVGKNYMNRQPLVLTEKIIKEIDEDYAIPSLLEKIDLVMDFLELKTEFFSEKMMIDPNFHFPLFFCKNNYELRKIMSYLVSVEYIKTEFSFSDNSKSVHYGKEEDFDNNLYRFNYYPIETCYTDNTHKNCQITIFTYGSIEFSLTTKGLKYQSDKNKNFLNAKQGFVAMWFNDKEDKKNYYPNMHTVYSTAIKPAIESNNLFNALRIDHKEHSNDINDEMIAEIRKSRFVIADLTGYRGGVYFEAGFAYGLGIPVIYTCHDKWLETTKNTKGEIVREGVHFDLSHRNMILWSEKDLEEFKIKLTNRIEAIIV